MAKTWLPDPSHYPEQMTPLSASVWFASMGHGLHEAMRELAGPFGGFETRTELGWAYEGELEPEWEHEPAVLREAALTLAERWERELKPRVEALTREQEAMRPEEPPPAEVATERERLEAETLARARALREVLEPVKAAAPLKETHTYFVDYPALLATREALRGFGRRLAADGSLADADDVWMLSVDELREAVLDWPQPQAAKEAPPTKS